MEVKILITGDYCPIGRNIRSIEKGDFSFMQTIKPFVSKADLSITNLEAPITNAGAPIIKSGPNIKAGLDSLQPLVDCGFDLVTLANNHILDYGEQGIKDTLENCALHELSTVGAASNIFNARLPFIKTIKNKKIGILNFAEQEYCAATKHSYGANPVDLITNHRDIKKLKESVDFVLVIAHGGREHYQLPTPQLRERYRFYAESGADAVIGHHPHCFSGYEVFNGSPIFYSLGNFIFDYKKKYQKGTWTRGYGVELIFNEIKIDFNLVPFHQGREENPTLTLFNEIEKEEFHRDIDRLNSIIIDDSLFDKAWEEYLETQEIGYKGLLWLQNDYIRAAVVKGLLPRLFFHSNHHKAIMLNLLRCQTHHEISKAILERDLENRK